MASAHSSRGAPAATSIVRALSTSVRFALSTMPLCCGVYGSVCLALTPFCAQNLASSALTNSPPPSVWNSLGHFPVWFEIRSAHAMIAPAASLFCLSMRTQMRELNSSMMTST